MKVLMLHFSSYFNMFSPPKSVTHELSRGRSLRRANIWDLEATQASGTSMYIPPNALKVAKGNACHVFQLFLTAETEQSALRSCFLLQVSS